VVAVEGGESANSTSVSRVREIIDLERWANRERDDVIREANEPALDLKEGGCITDEIDELVEVAEPRLVPRYDWLGS
jgi:hypothetical protein